MPTKWDSKAKRIGKRLTKREKLYFLQYYEAEMGQGRNREQILGEMAREIGVSSNRQVERIIAQAKRHRKEVEMHCDELSVTALKLADILSRHLEYPVTVIPFRTQDFPYKGLQYEILPFGGQLVELAELDREKVSNLVCHLKAEMPELVSIFEITIMARAKVHSVFFDFPLARDANIPMKQRAAKMINATFMPATKAE